MKYKLNEETFGDAIKNYEPESKVVYKEVGEYEDKLNADDNVAVVDADKDGKIEPEETNDVFEILTSAIVFPSDTFFSIFLSTLPP